MTKIAISHLGLCTPLGKTAAIVLSRLSRGDVGAMKNRTDIIPDAETLVGQVSFDLPVIPESLAKYDCRNNRLLLCAAEQIADRVARAKVDWGPQRIGIVIGTSTSGIQAGEDALKIR